MVVEQTILSLLIFILFLFQVRFPHDDCVLYHRDVLSSCCSCCSRLELIIIYTFKTQISFLFYLVYIRVLRRHMKGKRCATPQYMVSIKMIVGINIRYGRSWLLVLWRICRTRQSKLKKSIHFIMNAISVQIKRNRLKGICCAWKFVLTQSEHSHRWKTHSQ